VIGTYVWTDGRKYEGMWKNGKMEGKGKFCFTDKRVYDGDFVNDLREGYGVMTW
jgi:hypothetical protein